MITSLHPFFLLANSPWPLISSMSALNLLWAMVMFFKFNEFYNFTLSIMNLMAVSLFWWIYYSSEFNLEGKMSSNLEQGLKFSMIMFISSEVFFFFSFFWAYFHFYLSPNFEIGMIWPPFNLEMFDFSNLPLINTLILMMSGITVTLSHYFMIEGKFEISKKFLFFTILLGLLFTTFQGSEYSSSFFSMTDSSFGSSFFILTGFHGIHVIAGSFFLTLTMLRFNKMISTRKDCLSFELSSWYWHFVDVIWLFLYFLIYYGNNI